MKMASRSVAFLLGFALLSLAVFPQHATAQGTVHTVGDSAGWSIPPNGAGAAYYVSYAARNSFVVGDSLVFNFRTGEHDVARVPKTSYDLCDDDNEIGETIEVGPATISLTTAGEYYFICTIGRHCSLGQKLAINVTATRAAIPPPTNTPRPPTTMTPSPKGLPAPDVPCAPTPSPTSGGSSPSGSGPQVTSPPGSSANAVVAAFSVTLFGIILSLF